VFEVIGKGRDGLWSAPVEMPFRIAPPYWLTSWFWSLILFGVSVLAAAAYRYRVAYLLRMERLRLRIARDLHDDVGANLSTMALQLDVLRLTRPDDQTSRLQTLGQMARETAHTLREIVWIVNSEFDTLDKLVQKLQDTTAALLSQTGIRYTITVEGVVPAITLAMEWRQHVFFSYKEILQNVVKHAEAQQVQVTIEATGRTLCIQVRDDGQGFDFTNVPPGNGRRHLARRAEALQGDVSYESVEGVGTTVVLSAPLQA